jgi:hypothetical protein
MHRVAFSVDDIDVALEIAAAHGCHAVLVRSAHGSGFAAEANPQASAVR